MDKDMEARIRAIEKAEPETPTKEDIVAIEQAEAENDYAELEPVQ